MIASRSIGVRLTVWYLAILALGFALFATAGWFAVRLSAQTAVDAELRDRLRGLEQFIRTQLTAQPNVDLTDELHEHSVLGPGGDLIQVAAERGAWVYRSAVLEKGNVPILKPEDLVAGGETVFADFDVQSKPVRCATTRIDVAGRSYLIQVGSPMSALLETLSRLGQTLWLLMPLLLAGAGLGGFWISRRALAPVDAITNAAESISISNLSNRLDVPATGDELERLSETMNRMLERLQSSVERMTQFTADASHELRAPMAVIRTTAELATRGERSPADLHDDMAQILFEAERTTSLIESLLLLARADASGHPQLQLEPADLAACARDAVEQARHTAAAHGLTIRLAVPAEPLMVSGDAQGLRRLLFNLVDNGIKYNQPKGSVEVALGRVGADAVCTVTDTGIGISPADHARIFDRFWRADKARSRSSGGAGLGLAIARWIVERHHGSIDVRSEAGHGAVFEVRLPILCSSADAGEQSIQ